MKCIFCKQPARFLKSYHSACMEEKQEIILKIKNIIQNVQEHVICAVDGKVELVKLVSSNLFYKNYLKHEINDCTAIRTNETIIYIESGLKFSKSMNSYKMVRTGYRYEKVPSWNVTNVLVGQNVQLVFTDKSVYMLFDGKVLSYSYKKIVNLGVEENLRYTYFDIKTSSPYPHRFFIQSFCKNDSIKIQNVYLFLSCLMDYHPMFDR
ncbi:hypothetical protein ACWG0P_09470 [Amedibacillus sp. YH-ame6]